MNPTCYDCENPPTEGRVRCAECAKRVSDRVAKSKASSAIHLAKSNIVGIKINRQLSTGMVAKMCGVAPRTASKWIDSGRLKGHRLPGSNDRRVKIPDLVAFLVAHKMDVPGELLPGAHVTVGIPEQLPGFLSLDVFGLGCLAAQTAIATLVIGDADGLQIALDTARAVRESNPTAKIIVLLDPANASIELLGLFDTVAVRPCDVAALVAELTAGTATTAGR